MGFLEPLLPHVIPSMLHVRLTTTSIKHILHEIQSIIQLERNLTSRCPATMMAKLQSKVNKSGDPNDGGDAIECFILGPGVHQDNG